MVLSKHPSSVLQTQNRMSCFIRKLITVLLHKLKSYGISGQIFGLISSFLSNRREKNEKCFSNKKLSIQVTRNIKLKR